MGATGTNSSMVDVSGYVDVCVCVAGIDLGEYVDVCTCIYIYIYRYCMYWHACVNVSMHVYRRTRCRDCIP